MFFFFVKDRFFVILSQELKAAKTCEMPRIGSVSSGGSGGWPPLELSGADGAIPPVSVIKQEASLCGRDLWSDCSLDGGQGSVASSQKGSTAVVPQQGSSFGMRMPLLSSIGHHHESSAPRSAFITPVGMNPILPPYSASGTRDQGRLTSLTPLTPGNSQELRNPPPPSGRGIEPRGCAAAACEEQPHLKTTNVSTATRVCQTNLAEMGHSGRNNSPRSPDSDERRVLVPAGKKWYTPFSGGSRISRSRAPNRWGRCRSPMRALFGENVCENERIGSPLGEGARTGGVPWIHQGYCTLSSSKIVSIEREREIFFH